MKTPNQSKFPLPAWLSESSGLVRASQPQSLTAPRLALFNQPLADTIDWSPGFDKAPATLLQYLSGEQNWPGFSPVSLGYAGHQFGIFAAQLGDGRAHLIARVQAAQRHYELQLKGSGTTPWTVSGDGKLPLSAALREYIYSEALNGLGIPVTRAFAVVTSATRLHRNPAEPAAILARLSASHLRIGTFEWLAIRHDWATMDSIVMGLHNRSAGLPLFNYAGWYSDLCQRLARLGGSWMSAGFVHGVLNTDNISLVGETLDLGPCAFIDIFDPNACFSAVDAAGRYRFAAQPHALFWGLNKLAQCIAQRLSFASAQQPELKARLDAELEKVKHALSAFSPALESAWLAQLSQRLGLRAADDKAHKLCQAWLSLLQDHKVDYHRAFDELYTWLSQGEVVSLKPAWLTATNAGQWLHEYQQAGPDLAMMRRANPRFSARLDWVETVIRQACEDHDFSAIERFVSACRQPYTEPPAAWQHRAALRPKGLQRTFCGT